MSNTVISGDTKNVPIGSLKPYGKNPRKGNIKAIADSLAINKQYRPIVVQKSTMQILAGNHTWLAAKKLGWKEISVVFVDVDDKAAKRIVLADNKTSDLAEYDEQILAEVLRDLATSEGTGYSQNEMEQILAGATLAAEEIVSIAEKESEESVWNGEEDSGFGSPSSAEFGDDDEGSDFGFEGEEQSDEFNDAQARLQGVLQLSDEAYFEMGKNKYDIPPIRTDRLVTELPSPLTTWGGKDATPDDGVSHYIWNYGLASPTGMPYDRSILCFYTYDFKFEMWWEKPSYYTAKVMNLGIKSAIAPDFSVWYDDPKVFQLFSIYRAQWFARYFQEAGLPVIPRVIMSDKQEMLDVSFLGIPKNCPVLSMSMQTFDENNPKELAVASDSLKYICEKMKPQKLLVYGGNPSLRVIQNTNSGDTEVVHVMNYAGVRRGKVFNNPDGLEGEKKKKRSRARLT